MMIETDRLLLRRWIEEDREPFFRLNSDARVVEFMPNCLSRSQSDLLVDRIEEHFRKHSFGLYALELREDQGSHKPDLGSTVIKSVILMAANADETDEAADKRLPGWIRAGRVKSTNSSLNVRGSDIRDNFGTIEEREFRWFYVGGTSN
jgi:hypothetical protein